MTAKVSKSECHSLSLSTSLLLFLVLDYQPVERYGHSTVQVGDYLYMWGGNQPDLPRVHNNEEKKSMCSVVEVCHLATGMWEQKPTTGTPPLGVDGYSTAVIRNEIYFFGGLCNHDKCYHNSLYR